MDATVRIAAIARTEAVLDRIATLAQPAPAAAIDASGCMQALLEHERVMAELASLVDDLASLRGYGVAGSDATALDAVVEPVVRAARQALDRAAGLAAHREALSGALAAAEWASPAAADARGRAGARAAPALAG